MNDKSIIDLLYRAKESRIDIFLKEGQLQLKLPKNSGVDTTLFEEIKLSKESIIAFLQTNERIASINNKITKIDRQATEFVPLSFSQERLWFVDQLEGSIAYHLPTIIRLKGQIDIEALSNTLQSIITRHELLRTVLLQQGGQGYQQLIEIDNWKLNVADGSMYVNNLPGLHHYIQELVDKPFDLSRDYMLRADLITLTAKESILLVTIHHIASDAWSTAIIVKEVVELYSSYIENKPAHLYPLPIQYADYATWQRNYLQGAVLDKKLLYWKEKLEGTVPLNLPTDFTRPSSWSGHGSIKRFTIDKNLTTDLRGLSKQYESTLFMTLLTAFNILMHRYSGQNDICVGTSVANRTQKEIEGLVGFFVNLLALRNEVNDEVSFVELLQQVKTTTLQASEHQDVPFEKVVDAVVKQRDISKNPLIQVMFIMLNTPTVPDLQLGDLTLTNEELQHTKTLFDLSFFINETEKGIEGWAEYSTDLFSEQTISQMIENFKELLKNVSSDPDQLVGTVPIMSKSDEQRLLVDINRSETSYPYGKTIRDLFEEQVSKTPHLIAVVFGQTQITYKELNERSNQLAHFLITKNVRSEVLVPICIERGIEMIVGILGILKAGGAYVPIDPHYPRDRISYMLDDILATIILTSKESKQKFLNKSGLEIIEIAKDNISINCKPVDNPVVDIHPDNVAYVIYTSGSSGRPKGVLIEHRNVVRLFKTDDPIFDFNDSDVWTLFHSFSFDFSVWEIFGALLFGGKLIVVPVEATKDVFLFSELLLKEKVTVLNQTPSAFYVLQDHLVEITSQVSIRYVIFGGEALNLSKLEAWKQNYANCKLINMYGITETTVHVTFFEVEWEHIMSGKSIIGKPIPTLSCFILNEVQSLVPIGVSGELYVGGEGVARGYLNREELTAERFVKNSFANVKITRLYRTGDLGRWLPDGNIEYIGRMDDQVKMRGYRIELGEVEAALQQSGLVKQGVVVLREFGKNNKQLVGYIVPKDLYNNEELSSYLHKTLPEYMIPTLWVQLESLPLTSNGKIDRKALPDADITEQLNHQYVEARNEVETMLVNLWQELLQTERVGIHDNFFELGGDSIITIQVVSRAKRLGYSFKPKDLFIHQTIAGLAANISGLKEGSLFATVEEDLQGKSAGLLPVQQWFFETTHIAQSHFNQGILLALDKTLPKTILHQAIQKLAIQHDALRFKYFQKNGKWQQEYGFAEIQILNEDLRDKPQDALAGEIGKIAERYQRSLHLANGEIIKVVWIQTPREEAANRLLIIIHHLAIDGVSWRIVLEELDRLFTQLHENKSTGSNLKSTSYRQWYQTLEQYGQRIGGQLKYWQGTVKAYKPFATDYDYAGAIKVTDNGTLTLKLEANYTQSLIKEVPRVYHTEINDILLCALGKTLCAWTTMDNVVIGLEGHGREPIDDLVDVSRTVGWFTSLYPVLLTIKHPSGVGDLIKSVKEQLRDVPDKGLGYGVMRYINREESLPKTDPWDIQFNYFGQLDNVVGESKWLGLASEHTGAGRSEDHELSEKLSVNCHISAGHLVIVWRYSSKHFRLDTIKGLAGNYLSNLQLLINHCTEQGKTGAVFTPSDYGLGSSITYEELDAFLEENQGDNIMSF